GDALKIHLNADKAYWSGAPGSPSEDVENEESRIRSAAPGRCARASGRCAAERLDHARPTRGEPAGHFAINRHANAGSTRSQPAGHLASNWHGDGGPTRSQPASPLRPRRSG